MTSKEALEMIVVDLVPKAKENNKEEIEQVEKDLEMLEILKKKLVELNRVHTYSDYRVYNCYQYSPKLYLTKKEFDKIKEWLER